MGAIHQSHPPDLLLPTTQKSLETLIRDIPVSTLCPPVHLTVPQKKRVTITSSRMYSNCTHAHSHTGIGYNKSTSIREVTVPPSPLGLAESLAVASSGVDRASNVFADRPPTNPTKYFGASTGPHYKQALRP